MVSSARMATHLQHGWQHGCNTFPTMVSSARLAVSPQSQMSLRPAGATQSLIVIAKWCGNLLSIATQHWATGPAAAAVRSQQTSQAKSSEIEGSFLRKALMPSSDIAGQILAHKSAILRLST